VYRASINDGNKSHSGSLTHIKSDAAEVNGRHYRWMGLPTSPVACRLSDFTAAWLHKVISRSRARLRTIWCC